MFTFTALDGVSKRSRAKDLSDIARLPRVQDGNDQAVQRAKQFPQYLVHPDSLVRTRLHLLLYRLTDSYVFLGCSRQRDASITAKAFEVEAGNKIGQGRGGLMTPTSPFTAPVIGSPTIDRVKGVNGVPDFFSLGPSMVEKSLGSAGQEWTQTIQDVGAPLSPFHYHLRKVSSFYPCPAERD